MMHLKIDIAFCGSVGQRQVKLNKGAIYNHVLTEYVEEGIHRLKMHKE